MPPKLYSEQETQWLLFYHMLGLTIPQIKLLHNKRFPNAIRSDDAIRAKLKLLRQANGMDSSRVDREAIKNYLQGIIKTCDISLQYYFPSETLPPDDKRLLEADVRYGISLADNTIEIS